MSSRSVAKIVKGYKVVDGAGVHLVRVLGPNTIKAFDPFLLLDAFDSKDPKKYLPGFPMHPHRGIETVTYLIHGVLNHKDSLGHEGVIHDGCCQWMTAGGGILHQEMPQSVPHLLGLQLWINLPAKDKFAPPKYRDIEAETLPVTREDGVEVRILCGTYKGTAGAMQADYVPAVYLDAHLAPGRVWTVETAPGNTVFAYLLEGEVSCEEGGEMLAPHRAVLLGDGNFARFEAGPEGARFVFLSAPPLKEPVAWGGPIVMNTQEELDTAFRDLRWGAFLRHRESE